MNRATRRTITGVAKRPPARTVDVTMPADSEFAGWRVIARADFPFRMIATLQSSNADDIIATLDAIVLEHNLPTTGGELASSMGDVDPYRGALAIAGEIFDALAKLPNR